MGESRAGRAWGPEVAGAPPPLASFCLPTRRHVAAAFTEPQMLTKLS